MNDILLIGFGAMGRDVHARLQHEADVRVRYVLVRESACERVRPMLGDACEAISSLDQIRMPVCAALECAGHDAVRDFVPALLRRGIDTVIASVGTLAEPGVPDELERASADGGAQLALTPGALAGIDALAAARPYGIDTVRYVGRKPAHGWLDTAAEACCDLRNLSAPVTFFEGTARQAASAYPKNANVAAMIGMAGVGLDATRVQLIADPDARANTHTIAAEGAFGRLTATIEARALADNPKTSALAAMSIVRLVRNRVAKISI